jgi:hypothetical protein
MLPVIQTIEIGRSSLKYLSRLHSSVSALRGYLAERPRTEHFESTLILTSLHKYVPFSKRAPGLLYPGLNYSHEILGRFSNIIDKLSDARSLQGHAQGHPVSRKLKAEYQGPVELPGLLTGLEGVFGSVAPSTLMLGRVCS